MSLHNLETSLTPAEHTALWNVLVRLQEDTRAKYEKAIANREELSHADAYLRQNMETARLWLNNQSEKFYQEWESLPAGSHLKAAYEEQVWTWSDRDMAAMTSTEPTEKPERPGA